MSNSMMVFVSMWFKLCTCLFGNVSPSDGVSLCDDLSLVAVRMRWIVSVWSSTCLSLMHPLLSSSSKVKLVGWIRRVHTRLVICFLWSWDVHNDGDIRSGSFIYLLGLYCGLRGTAESEQSMTTSDAACFMRIIIIVVVIFVMNIILSLSSSAQLVVVAVVVVVVVVASLQWGTADAGIKDSSVENPVLKASPF